MSASSNRLKRLKKLENLFLYMLVLCFAFSSAAKAGDIIQASVKHDDGVYSLLVEMQIQRSARSIRELLTDFDKMKLYNKSVIESRRLRSSDPQVTLGRIEMKDCVLFFCTKLVQVQETRKLANGDLQVTILPRFSDYRMGKSIWHIASQEDGSTRLRIDAVMEPKLWVPPLVGPAMVSDLLKNRALSMMENLEALARPNPIRLGLAKAK
ncbi:MAG: SRPBCC family protein [Gammaproteobacteria bacterium]|nr:SRPBCC family protein [Gammaproteobacteria bacterium]